MCLNPKIASYTYRTVINKKGKLIWRKIIKFEHEKTPDEDYRTIALPCGKCEQCRTAQAAEWGTRAVIELRAHKESCFITLTYNAENLPKKRSLKLTDLQKFWKRLRKNTKIKLRYIACGEYGPKTKRPHYHAIVFGYTPKDLKYKETTKQGDMLYTSIELTKIWGKGYAIIGKATEQSAAYVARYTTKKLTETKTIKRGREKEFIIMSRRPAIGSWIYNDKKEWKKIIRNRGIIIKTKGKTIIRPIPRIYKKKWIEEDEMNYYETMEEWKEEKQIIGNFWKKQQTNKIKWQQIKNTFKRDKI